MIAEYEKCNVPPTEGMVVDKELLIIAECVRKDSPLEYSKLIENKQMFMGCPVENINCDYVEKIMTLIQMRDLELIRVVMTKTSCSGCLRDAVREAVKESGQKILVKFELI
ncbi:hypothetical protein ACFL0V_02555 [Nanoarchaeota archaeon]